ncbi:MAG: glycosyltransferase, partial [Candidatus Omnitrophica bacterium]|nr:glycosyltransferase [Candidatus Omnitrophota bacterium]
MYKEEKRLLPKSQDNPLGEDALRVKVRELEEVRKTIPQFSWRLLCIDDGSPDNSSAKCVEKLKKEIANEFGKEIANRIMLEIITPEQKKLLNSKKGGAVLKGFEIALKDDWANFIGYTDVDTSISLNQIIDLLKPLIRKEASVAIGSRWTKEAEIKSISFFGRLSSRIYNWLVRIILFPLFKIKDTQRGFKLFEREVIEKILPFTKDRTLSFDTELLLLSILAGYKIKEVPIIWVDSAQARTFSMLKEAPKMLWGVIKQTRHIFNNPFNEFLQKLNKVLLFSIFSFGLIFLIYLFGGFSWYIAIKNSTPKGALIYLPAAILDIISGIIMWAICDFIGQYLNQKNVRLSQSFIVGAFGIFQGLATHILYNLVEILPNLAWIFAQKILRTLFVLIGGLFISFVFTQVISLSRKFLKVEGYSKTKEWQKTGEVILIKFIIAPLKTFIIVNLFPLAIRVISEQIWDYIMTVFSSYLMNRKDPLFIHHFRTLTKVDLSADSNKDLSRRQVNYIIKEALKREPQHTVLDDSEDILKIIRIFFAVDHKGLFKIENIRYERIASVLRYYSLEVHILKTLDARGFWQIDTKKKILKIFVKDGEDVGRVVVHEIAAAITATFKFYDPKLKKWILRPTSHQTNLEIEEDFASYIEFFGQRPIGFIYQFSETAKNEIFGIKKGKTDLSAGLNHKTNTQPTYNYRTQLLQNLSFLYKPLWRKVALAMKRLAEETEGLEEKERLLKNLERKLAKQLEGLNEKEKQYVLKREENQRLKRLIEKLKESIEKYEQKIKQLQIKLSEEDYARYVISRKFYSWFKDYLYSYNNLPTKEEINRKISSLIEEYERYFGNIDLNVR